MRALLEPLKTAKLYFKNRLIMPPMATSKSEKDGTVNQALLDYYAEKSEGGYISMIIIEHSFINKQGKASEGQLSVANDDVIDQLKQLAETIKNNGTHAIMQINHAGSAASSEVTGLDIVSSSDTANPRTGIVPKELTVDEIREIVQEFKEAAVRVQKSGFDGVEIHSAHGYLLNQFFSPLTNKRTDEYGGETKDRIKIHLEIISAIRQAVGEDFPILLRLGASDFREGGTTIEDSKIAAAEFERAGVDIIDISGGFGGYMVPGLTGQGFFSPLTEEIKTVVSVPVILTGGVTDAEAADKLISSNKADLIGVGRAIYSDSKWAKNAINR